MKSIGSLDWSWVPMTMSPSRSAFASFWRGSAPCCGGTTELDAERGRWGFGGWQLDRRTRRLVDSSEIEVPLTKGEYALLTAFLDAPQRPLSREHLLQATRVHEDIFDRSIDVQILRLRRKLEADPSAPQVIRTERGVGYVFALPVERVRGSVFQS